MTRCATQDQEIILLRKKIAKVEDLILSSSKPKEKVAYAEKMKKYAKQLEDLLLRQFEGSTTPIFSLQDQEFDDVGYDSSDLQMSYSSLSMDPRGESSSSASVLPIPSTPVKKTKSSSTPPPSLLSTPSSSSTSGASSSSKSPRQRLPFECVLGVDQNGNRVLKFELSPDKEKPEEDSGDESSDSEEEKWKSRKMKVLTARPPRPSSASQSNKVKKSQSCPSKQDSYEKLLQDMSEEYPISPTKQRRSWKAKAKSKSTPSSKRATTQGTVLKEDSGEDASSSSSGEEEPPFSPRYNCNTTTTTTSTSTPRKSSGKTTNTSIVAGSPKSTMMVVPSPPL